MSSIPFLVRPPETAIALRGDEVISAGQFARDVARLAARLPARRHVLNHCDDRYHFLVGFAAALVRGQVSLFPSSRTSEALAQLARAYPDSYCLTDQSGEPEFPVTVRYAEGGAPAGLAPLPALPADQQAAIFFTSGSTGVPQAHAKTWGAFVHEADLAGRSLGLVPGGPGAIVATVPPQHLYGFTMSVMLPLRFGYLLCAERPFFPEDVRRTLTACPYAPVLVTTPLQLRACVLERPQLPPLDFILSSTAPLDTSIAQAAEGAFATRVLEIYGSTETGAIAWRRQHDGPRWQGFEGLQFNADERGLEVVAPYLPAPVTLGDQVELHGERQFLLRGRNADLVKIAGKRISLGELNRQLLAIPGVADGVFFCPDTPGTQEPRLTAFVVAPGKTREEILDALRPRLDPVFLPRPLRLVSALPRNDTGKLPRGNLVRLWEEETRREAAAG